MVALVFPAKLLGGAVLLAVIGVAIAVMVTHAPIGAQVPPQDNLPELTDSGLRWGRLVLRHSIQVDNGGNPRNPPFIDSELAHSIAVAAAAVNRAARVSPSAIPSDPALLAFRNLLETLAAAGDTVTFDDVSALYSALNEQQTVFPPQSGSSTVTALADDQNPLEKVLNYVLAIPGWSPDAREAERNTEGERFVPQQINPVADIDYVNGIQTNLVNALEIVDYLSRELGRAVGHIHNAAGPLPGDWLQTLFQALRASNDPAVEEVMNQVLEHAQNGRPYILLCHSQGATVCAQGVDDAFAVADQNMRQAIQQNVRVITLGGFTKDSDFPAGIARRICHPGDPVCPAAEAIDFMKPIRVIRGALTALIGLLNTRNHSLKDSYLPRDPCSPLGECNAGFCSNDGRLCNVKSRPVVIEALEDAEVDLATQGIPNIVSSAACTFDGTTQVIGTNGLPITLYNFTISAGGHASGPAGAELLVIDRFLGSAPMLTTSVGLGITNWSAMYQRQAFEFAPLSVGLRDFCTPTECLPIPSAVDLFVGNILVASKAYTCPNPLTP
jgi:hypothetical protein